MLDNKMRNKGFTLIELLIVIAIVAILSVVVILTLNPAELLRQSRDSSRISDMSTLKTALSLYLADTLIPNLASTTAGYTACYLSTVSGVGTTTAKCGVFIGAIITSNSSTTAGFYRRMDATGWIPVSFSQISAGTPFSSLPIDPTNNSAFYYTYAASSTPNSVFEINAFMESSKYGKNGPKDTVSGDGGDNTNTFEVGNNLVL